MLVPSIKALRRQVRRSPCLRSATTGALLGGNGDTMISYVPQPKLVEQLGWDEPDINVLKRANFDDGTSIWGDPMESMSVPVKKWTNGTKAALTNSTNTIQQQPQQQQQQQPPAQQQAPPTPQVVQKPVAASGPPGASSQMVLNDENWPKQQSPTLVPPPISQWNSESVASSGIDPGSGAQAQNYRAQQNNWNPHGSDDWFREGVVDTSDWGLQGPPQKAPFDPYKDQIDTSNWTVQSSGGMPGQLPMAGRNRFPNEYDFNENPHDVRMSAFDNQPITDPYRQTPDMKNPMMNLGGGMMPSTHHPFPPRPGSHFPSQGGNILRPINPNAALSTPPGAMISQSSHLSPKLPTSSPVPNQAPYVPSGGKANPIPNQSSQPSASAQSAGNGNNNGTVHAQIMQQFRLAVQAGLISQDLLNTKLPPYMLQVGSFRSQATHVRWARFSFCRSCSSCSRSSNS